MMFKRIGDHYTTQCVLTRQFYPIGRENNTKFMDEPEYKWLEQTFGPEGGRWDFNVGWLISGSDFEHPVYVLFEDERDALHFGLMFDCIPEPIDQ